MTLFFVHMVQDDSSTVGLCGANLIDVPNEGRGVTPIQCAICLGTFLGVKQAPN